MNYGRGGCARDTTVVDKNNKVKMGREADRRSPFIPRHDDIMTRRDCIESFYITAYIRIDRTRRSNSPIGRKYRAAGVIRRAIKITILSHEARIYPSPLFEQG